jgi:hypothetical protein
MYRRIVVFLAAFAASVLLTFQPVQAGKGSNPPVTPKFALAWLGSSDPNCFWSKAEAINDEGDMTLSIHDSTGSFAYVHPYPWVEGVANIKILSPEGSYWSMSAMNRAGQISGSVKLGGVSNNDSGDVVGSTTDLQQAFLYRDAFGVLNLKAAVVNPPAGFAAMRMTAEDINNASWIIGGLGEHACLLKPSP